MAVATGSMQEPSQGWALVCHVCRRSWPEDQPMSVVAEHWNEHAGHEFQTDDGPHVAELDTPYLELVWLGPGPAPERRRLA